MTRKRWKPEATPGPCLQERENGTDVPGAPGERQQGVTEG